MKNQLSIANCFLKLVGQIEKRLYNPYAFVKNEIIWCETRFAKYLKVTRKILGISFIARSFLAQESESQMWIYYHLKTNLQGYFFGKCVDRRVVVPWTIFRLLKKYFS